MIAVRPKTDPHVAIATEAAALPSLRVSAFRQAWGKLRENRLALVSAVVLLAYVVIALVAFAGALGGQIETTVGPSYAPPRLTSPETDAVTPSLWLGTDFLGRSVLWRLLYGAQVALTVALLASLISIAIGTLLGLVAGYFGGWVDGVVTWLFTTVSSIPGILLLIAFAFVLKDYELPFVTGERGEPVSLSGIPTIVIALGLTSWVGLCRLVRAEAIKLRDRDYVTAARAVGIRDGRIILRHVLPNVFHLILIDFSIGVGAFVQAEVVLSFLGLGVADQPSWGKMIDDAKLELLKGVWWQMGAATVAIFLFSLAVNLLGDALRDALDPRLRGVD